MIPLICWSLEDLMHIKNMPKIRRNLSLSRDDLLPLSDPEETEQELGLHPRASQDS